MDIFFSLMCCINQQSDVMMAKAMVDNWVKSGQKVVESSDLAANEKEVNARNKSISITDPPSRQKKPSR